jgi:hypothetical protein
MSASAGAPHILICHMIGHHNSRIVVHYLPAEFNALVPQWPVFMS